MDPLIALRKQRWADLHNATVASRSVVLVRYAEWDTAPEWAPPYPEKKAQRIGRAVWGYEQMAQRIGWLDDDTIPYADVYTGTEIFAEAFGCPVHRLEGTNPHARPLITEASQVSRLKVPDLSHPSLALLFEIADECRRRTGPDAVLKIPDIQSPMDIAAMIWDKTQFYMGLFDAPEAVRELADKCRQLLTNFCDEWFRRYGRDFVAHFPDYYMPHGITLSEDEVGSVNSEMFLEFFLPHLAALSDRYGGIGIHCCATARHQWDNFKKIPNLRVLNLSHGPDYARDGYHFFRERCIHMHDGPPSPEWILQESPREARVVLSVGAGTRQEAVEALLKFRQMSG